MSAEVIRLMLLVPRALTGGQQPSQFKCWFCRKSYRQVQTLFGAEYPVRDPHDFASETLIFICSECITRFAESLAQKSP